jgi:hypothetical protein
VALYFLHKLGFTDSDKDLGAVLKENQALFETVVREGIAALTSGSKNIELDANVQSTSFQKAKMAASFL